MRKKFAQDLLELMAIEEKIVVIVGDLGYGMFDKIRAKYPKRFYNVGAAEQAMMAMAVGMALKGMIPVVYSITPFLLFRPMEVIRNYIDHESIPVIMVGAGRGKDYHDAGFTHDASDHEIMKQFPNINIVIPENDFNLADIIQSGKPTYLNLHR